MFETEFLKQILSNLLSISVIGAFVTWFLKEIISKFFKSDIEKFKNKLQTEIEIHKSKLQFEYHKNTKLHDDQCEFIKTLFQKLSTLDILLKNFVRLVEEDRIVEKRDIDNILRPLTDGVFEIEKFYKTNKILLNKSLSEKVNATIQLLFQALTRTSFALLVKSKDYYSDAGAHLGIVNRKMSELDINEKQEFESIMKEISELRKGNIKDSLNEIENNFREIYGVI
jgi:hypothetical protein